MRFFLTTFSNASVDRRIVKGEVPIESPSPHKILKMFSKKSDCTLMYYILTLKQIYINCNLLFVCIYI